MLVQLTLTLKMTTTQVVQHQTLSLTTALFTTTLAWMIVIIPHSQIFVLISFLLCHFFKQILYFFCSKSIFFCSNWSSYNQLFIRYLTSAFSYIKFECFSLYFKLQVLLVDTNTGTPLPFGTLGVHKVLQRL